MNGEWSHCSEKLGATKAEDNEKLKQNLYLLNTKYCCISQEKGGRTFCTQNI